MPSTIEIDPVRRLVIVRVSGVLTVAEMAATRQQLKDDPAFDPGFDQLNDLRDVSKVDMTAEQLRQSAGHSIFGPHSRIAIVITRDNTATYGMIRMYELRRTARDPGRVGLFDAMDEAEAWLRAARTTD